MESNRFDLALEPAPRPGFGVIGVMGVMEMIELGAQDGEVPSFQYLGSSIKGGEGGFEILNEWLG